MTEHIVSTRSGEVVGRDVDGVLRFLGIPYAAAPNGPLRFLAPAPHAPWAQPRLAFDHGAAAPQERNARPGGLPDVPEPVIEGDEWLNLNIWTTEASVERRAPVLVWIHGGGFIAGSNAHPWYDGASFARHGLVFVSLNYRLGAEGFADIPGSTPNRGMRDWIAGLEWVRDNIAGFGGDPGTVTVFGQSAGGMAVAALMASDAAAGLFHRAIIASGVSSAPPVAPHDARAASAALARILDVDDTVEGFARRTPDELVAAQTAFAAAQGDDLTIESVRAGRAVRWAPEVEAGLLADRSPAESAGDSHGYSVPLLIGSTHDEFAWRYWLDDPADPRGQQLADAMFRRPTQEYIDARRGGAPTYRYEFRWRSSAFDGRVGAGHSLDIPYFFNNLDAPYITDYAGERLVPELAEAMHGAFADFALRGDPGWPSYLSGAADTVYVFDDDPREETGFVVPPTAP